MKLKVEHYNENVTFETERDDLSLDELHEIWEKVLFSMGFQHQTIKRFYE